MNVEQLQVMLHTQPFRPHRIHLACGRSLDVHHPEFVARARAGRGVIVNQPDDTFEVGDLLPVVSLEVLDGRSTEERTG